MNPLKVYKQWWGNNKNNIQDKTFMENAIGGQFDTIGAIERDLLIQCGLMPDGYVIDVGCGTGRLSLPLSKYITSGRYLGTDVLPEFVEHCKSEVNHPNFRFEITNGFTIPSEEQADIICFFSVFTHILHEESYLYLREAKKLLKPNGKIVLSFLEFAIPDHWNIFEQNISRVGIESPLNMFISKDAIKAWAEHLNLKILELHDGNKPFIKLSHDVVTEDGRNITGIATLGQSVCILSK